jgi:hypothetical protein
MTNPQICKVCGFPLDQHEVMLRWGIAHTAARDVDGRITHWCSEAAVDYSDFHGQIQALTTIVRSLRWRAGRLRSQGTVWHNYDLEYWATKIARDIERLQKLVVEHYSWTKEKR